MPKRRPPRTGRSVASLRLASPQELAPGWLREGGKTVLPFEPPLEIDDELAGRIRAAFRDEGQPVVWGFSSESWPGLRPHEGLVVPLGLLPAA